MSLARLPTYFQLRSIKKNRPGTKANINDVALSPRRFSYKTETSALGLTPWSQAVFSLNAFRSVSLKKNRPVHDSLRLWMVIYVTLLTTLQPWVPLAINSMLPKRVHCIVLHTLVYCMNFPQFPHTQQRAKKVGYQLASRPAVRYLKER